MAGKVTGPRGKNEKYFQIILRRYINAAKVAMKNIVYFDLETQKSAEEVGGWNKIRDMRMSIGVTYSTARGSYQIYGENEVNALIDELRRADLVVGFNSLRFDYEVLVGHNPFFDIEQVPTLDMLVELQKTLQHRLSLDSIAHATLGVEKTSEGLQAIRWYKENKMLEIAEYCCYDVKITRLVHEYGLSNKQLHYTNRYGKKLSVAVAWT
jgi:DEAD/DEAH box helicase domain-containing protein